MWKEINRQQEENGKCEIITMQGELDGKNALNVIVRTKNFNATYAQSNSVVFLDEQPVQTKGRSKKE